MRSWVKVSGMKPSAAIAAIPHALRLKTRRRDAIKFGAGEPDADTPDHLKISTDQETNRGEIAYASSAAADALKRAAIEKTRCNDDLGLASAQTSASCGASQTIFQHA